ncbi:MAG: hypothetical protein PF501_07635 [Salinisphaera sp.]|nr:hypothetical protein [Salinisphaera sp.]
MQVAGDGGCALVAYQSGFCDFGAVSLGAGADFLQGVAVGGAAAGAPASADVFGHSGETFLATHEAVDFVHRGQRAVHDDFGDGVQILRELGVADVDAAFFAFVAHDVRKVGASADAAGVGGQQDVPAAGR